MAVLLGSVRETKKERLIDLAKRYNKLNDMKDKAFNRGDMKSYRKLDRMAVVAFEKWIRLKA